MDDFTFFDKRVIPNLRNWRKEKATALSALLDEEALVSLFALEDVTQFMLFLKIRVFEERQHLIQECLPSPLKF